MSLKGGGGITMNKNDGLACAICTGQFAFCHECLVSPRLHSSSTTYKREHFIRWLFLQHKLCVSCGLCYLFLLIYSL